MPQQFDPSKPFEAAPPFDPSKPFTAAETVTGAHPEAKMSAAAPGMALPAGDDQSVTLGDLLHDPVDAMSRIGAAVKRDVSDPKLWASIALGYFGPKAADVVVPAVANAARATMRGAVAAAPDAVGVISPRAGNVIRMAQKFGQAMQQPPTEAPATPAEVAAAPPQPQPSPLDVTRAARDAYRAANGGAVQPASPAPTAPAVAAPPATAPAAPPAAAVPEPAPVPRGTPEPAPAAPSPSTPQTAPAIWKPKVPVESGKPVTFYDHPDFADPSKPPSAGVVYRGITADEAASIAKTGKVESTKAFSHASEGTSFAPDASGAESAVNFGRDNPAVTGKPNYVIEVKNGPDIAVDPRDGWPKSGAAIPADRIQQVWKFNPDGSVEKLPALPQTAPAPAQAGPPPRNPAMALKQAKDTFSAASEAPRPGELNRAMNFIMWGKSPDEALAAVLAQRAGGAATAVDPAAELLKRGFGVSDADVQAALHKKALSGTKSLMPKYGGDVGNTPAQSSTPDYGYGNRYGTTTPKGLGYLGPLQRQGGGVMSEYSIGVNLGGKEMEIPSIVPTLTKAEVSAILNAPEGTPPPSSVIQKAVEYAKQRLEAGKDVFAGPGEQQNLYPDLTRAAVPRIRTGGSQ